MGSVACCCSLRQGQWQPEPVQQERAEVHVKKDRVSVCVYVLVRVVQSEHVSSDAAIGLQSRSSRTLRDSGMSRCPCVVAGYWWDFRAKPGSASEKQSESPTHSLLSSHTCP